MTRQAIVSNTTSPLAHRCVALRSRELPGAFEAAGCAPRERMARRVLQEGKVVVYTVIGDGGDQGGNPRSPLMDRSSVDQEGQLRCGPAGRPGPSGRRRLVAQRRCEVGADQDRCVIRRHEGRHLQGQSVAALGRGRLPLLSSGPERFPWPRSVLGSSRPLPGHPGRHSPGTRVLRSASRIVPRSPAAASLPTPARRA